MDLHFYLKDIKKCSPMLLVGGYVADFRRICPNVNTIYLREKADMNKFIDDNSGKIFPTVLVIDLGVNVVPCVDRLLKFVEEYTGPLIITSHLDINNLVFLSRFKLAFRKSKEEVNFKLPSHKNTLMNGIDEDTKISDPILWYAYSKGLEEFSKFNSWSKAEKQVIKCIDIIYS